MAYSENVTFGYDEQIAGDLCYTSDIPAPMLFISHIHVKIPCTYYVVAGILGQDVYADYSYWFLGSMRLL